MSYLLNKLVKVGESLGKVISQVGERGDVLVMDEETTDLNKLNLDLAGMDVVDGREMTIEEFYDELANDSYYDTLIQELKFERSMNISNELLESTMREAIKRNVFLKDLNEFNSDKFFFEVAKNWQL